jgi:hypothetical protein
MQTDRRGFFASLAAAFCGWMGWRQKTNSTTVHIQHIPGSVIGFAEFPHGHNEGLQHRRELIIHESAPRANKAWPIYCYHQTTIGGNVGAIQPSRTSL